MDTDCSIIFHQDSHMHQPWKLTADTHLFQTVFSHPMHFTAKLIMTVLLGMDICHYLLWLFCWEWTYAITYYEDIVGNRHMPLLITKVFLGMEICPECFVGNGHILSLLYGPNTAATSPSFHTQNYVMLGLAWVTGSPQSSVVERVKQLQVLKKYIYKKRRDKKDTFEVY